MARNVVHDALFIKFLNFMESQPDVRERMIYYEIERVGNELTSLLQIVHDDDEDIPSLCHRARELFQEAKDGFKKLRETVPEAEYLKFNDQWRHITQHYCFLIALTVWLEDGTLVKHETIAQLLEIPVSNNEGFHLDLEDYLHGVLLLCTELARLTVNFATRGEYGRTIQIYIFVSEVNSRFRLLNLRSENLRHSYEALKHDVKKIEKTVYDLSLRGLLNIQEDSVEGNGATNEAPTEPTEPTDSDNVVTAN